VKSSLVTKFMDPVAFGLHPRTSVEVVDEATLAIVINRKSRIIMADGRKILAKAAKIKEAKPGCRVMLKTTAPVCGKTLQFLANQGIEVLRV
jgi:hypothetical protein